MSTTPITVQTKPKQTMAVYYDGRNADAVKDLATKTHQEVAGKGTLRTWSQADDGQRLIEPFMWVIIDSNQELQPLRPEIFLEHWSSEPVGQFIIEEADSGLLRVDVGSPLQMAAVTAEERPQPLPTPDPMAPVIPAAIADDPGVTMTPDEFAEWRRQKAAEAGDPPIESTSTAEGDDATDPLDSYEMPEDDDTEVDTDVDAEADTEEDKTAPEIPGRGVNDDGTPWSKKQWIELREEQGYSPNAVAKLPIPVIAVLPDVPPTSV